MRRIRLGIAAGAAFAGLVAAALAAGIALGPPGIATVGADRGATSTPQAAPRASTPTPTWSREVPTSTPTPVALRTCSIAAEAKSPDLLHFQGRVVDAKTGLALFDRGGSTPNRTASVLKVLTSAAALHVLGPDYRLTTRVVEGSEPGEIVLVGGGDVTLSRTPVGTTTAYAGAPHLATLVARTKAAWATRHPGVPITKLVLDSTYFGAPAWQPSWDLPERTEGFMPRITALMVDGDRDAPAAPVSRRSTDPVGRAGDAFAAQLGGAVHISTGAAPAGAHELASVQSQPVSTLIDQALIVSDNTLAETIARVTAIVSGAGNTFDAEQRGTVDALQVYGIPTAGIVVKDGSGLSPDNAVPPAYLTELFRQIAARDRNLGVIYDGLPIAGRTGSLSYSDRFQGAAARADGAVHAKTGWIDTGYTLAGVIHAKDGSTLTFAFYALGPAVTEANKTALDDITADVWACGKNLSDD